MKMLYVQVAIVPEESCEGKVEFRGSFIKGLLLRPLPCLFSLKCSSENHVSSLPCAGWESVCCVFEWWLCQLVAVRLLCISPCA